MNGSQILVVEDEPRMQRLLQSHLEARDFVVQVVSRGEDALTAAAQNPPSLVLLDITLPGINGIETCRRLRQTSAVPIILVTAAESPETKVIALEQGADDYLTKPFHADELVARMRAVLRRAGAIGAAPTVRPNRLEVSGVTIDLAGREVHRGGEPIHLTKIEFDLLRELVSQPDKVLSYEQLLTAVWGPGSTDIRPVHVHICNLRRKLEKGPTSRRHILAVPGIGYRFHLHD